MLGPFERASSVSADFSVGPRLTLNPGAPVEVSAFAYAGAGYYTFTSEPNYSTNVAMPILTGGHGYAIGARGGLEVTPGSLPERTEDLAHRLVALGETGREADSLPQRQRTGVGCPLGAPPLTEFRMPGTALGEGFSQPCQALPVHLLRARQKRIRSCRAESYETCRLCSDRCCNRWHASNSHHC